MVLLLRSNKVVAMSVLANAVFVVPVYFTRNTLPVNGVIEIASPSVTDATVVID
ncbi:hypothetical protein D3C71_2252600 [compost metagenome]